MGSSAATGWLVRVATAGLMALAGGACGRRGDAAPAPPTPVLRATHGADEPAPTAAATSGDAAARATATTALPAQRATPPAVQPRVTLTRAAALRADVVLAVGDDALYRLAGERWARVPLAGAAPRDVLVARGALWVLARGTGANAGTALVARTTTVEDLQVVGAVTLAPDSDPRALAVVRANEFYIGGARPALVHVTGGEYETLRVTDAVTALWWYRDETLFALHGTTRATTVRYGERARVELDDDFLSTFTDAAGAAYTAHTGGQIARGRPGREFAAVTSPTQTFAPRVAAVLANNRLAVVGTAGPFATWEHHNWRAVAGAFPTDPIAILPTTPPLVVGRRGEVVAVEGPDGPARVVVAAASASGP